MVTVQKVGAVLRKKHKCSHDVSRMNTTEGFKATSGFKKDVDPVRVKYTTGSWCRWSTEKRQEEEAKQLAAYTETLEAAGLTVKRVKQPYTTWGEFLEVS